MRADVSRRESARLGRTSAERCTRLRAWLRAARVGRARVGRARAPRGQAREVGQKRTRPARRRRVGRTHCSNLSSRERAPVSRGDMSRRSRVRATCKRPRTLFASLPGALRLCESCGSGAAAGLERHVLGELAGRAVAAGAGPRGRMRNAAADIARDLPLERACASILLSASDRLGVPFFWFCVPPTPGDPLFRRSGHTSATHFPPHPFRPDAQLCALRDSFFAQCSASRAKVESRTPISLRRSCVGTRLEDEDEGAVVAVAKSSRSAPCLLGTRRARCICGLPSTPMRPVDPSACSCDILELDSVHVFCSCSGSATAPGAGRGRVALGNVTAARSRRAGSARARGRSEGTGPSGQGGNCAAQRSRGKRAATPRRNRAGIAEGDFLHREEGGGGRGIEALGAKARRCGKCQGGC